MPWQEWTGRTGRSGNDRHGLGWLGRLGCAGWLAGGLPWFFSAFLLGCRLQVALQIKKERPQSTGKNEASKRPVDRKVAWSWLPYLVCTEYLTHLAHTGRVGHSHCPPTHTSTQPTPLSLSICLSVCKPVCISLRFLSSDEMAQRTQLVVS